MKKKTLLMKEKWNDKKFEPKDDSFPVSDILALSAAAVVVVGHDWEPCWKINFPWTSDL